MTIRSYISCARQDTQDQQTVYQNWERQWNRNYLIINWNGYASTLGLQRSEQWDATSWSPSSASSLSPTPSPPNDVVTNKSRWIFLADSRTLCCRVPRTQLRANHAPFPRRRPFKLWFFHNRNVNTDWRQQSTFFNCVITWIFGETFVRGTRARFALPVDWKLISTVCSETLLSSSLLDFALDPQQQ